VIVDGPPEAVRQHITMLDSDSIITSTSFVKQHEPRGARLRAENRERDRCDVRGVRLPLRTFDSEESTRRSGKEVIQPQVPLRLPCYDFAPVMTLAFGRSAPCGFLHGLRALATSMA
jgi:hypothetical protein